LSNKDLSALNNNSNDSNDNNSSNASSNLNANNVNNNGAAASNSNSSEIKNVNSTNNSILKQEHLLNCLAELFHQIVTMKKKKGIMQPKKFIARLRKDNGKIKKFFIIATRMPIMPRLFFTWLKFGIRFKRAYAQV
jgi:hypothetical protein